MMLSQNDILYNRLHSLTQECCCQIRTLKKLTAHKGDLELWKLQFLLCNVFKIYLKNNLPIYKKFNLIISDHKKKLIQLLKEESLKSILNEDGIEQQIQSLIKQQINYRIVFLEEQKPEEIYNIYEKYIGLLIKNITKIFEMPALYMPEIFNIKRKYSDISILINS